MMAILCEMTHPVTSSEAAIDESCQWLTVADLMQLASNVVKVRTTSAEILHARSSVYLALHLYPIEFGQPAKHDTC